MDTTELEVFTKLSTGWLKFFIYKRAGKMKREVAWQPHMTQDINMAFGLLIGTITPGLPESCESGLTNDAGA